MYPRRMKLRDLTLCGALLLAAGCRSGPTAESNPSLGGTTETRMREHARMAIAGESFDFYLLNLSWSPEYCYSHREAAECAAHATFVLHGLWPENSDGTYPENCSDAMGPADPAQYRDIYPEPELLAHEWQAHGTCSGLSPDAFFQTARAAFHSIAIPPKLSSISSQTSMPPDQIVNLFAKSNPGIPSSSIVVSCGHNYLTAVEVCLDKNLHPVACSAVRSCRANTVRIPPP
jgi:ribonuclease T2